MSMPETGPALQTLLTIQDILRKLPTAKPCRCLFGEVHGGGSRKVCQWSIYDMGSHNSSQFYASSHMFSRQKDISLIHDCFDHSRGFLLVSIFAMAPTVNGAYRGRYAPGQVIFPVKAFNESNESFERSLRMKQEALDTLDLVYAFDEGPQWA